MIFILKAARATGKTADKKWHAFVNAIKQTKPSKEQIKLIINSWDEENQWAPLHYAVYHNNMTVFNALTVCDESEKHFRCGAY